MLIRAETSATSMAYSWLFLAEKGVMRGKKGKEKKERDETKFPGESWILVSVLVEILEDRFEMEIIYSIRIVYL